MKKFILAITTLICYSTMAQEFEANIKAGYDFYRSSTVINEQNDKTSKVREYGKGFVIGLELLPLKFKNDKIKLGVGFEYNFGSNNVKYTVADITPKEQHPIATMIPVYATVKFTYYRPKNIDLNLYTFGRLGYAFAKEVSTNGGYPYYGKPDTSGLYYGLGLGIDYKYFLAEILYDGKYRRNLVKTIITSGAARDVSLIQQGENNFSHDFHHKIGVRLGIQLGTQHFKKAKIEPKVVEKIVEKIVEVEKVVEKKTTNKIIIKNFDISAEALFGFNKYKLSDLKEGGKQEIEEKVKELLKSGFEITGINVIGHTDRLGTDSYNYKLGLNRANTIAEYLKELGIKVEIKSSSKGKKEPKVHCNNVKSTSKLKECLGPNRRVELQFLGLETQQNIEEVIESK